MAEEYEQLSLFLNDQVSEAEDHYKSGLQEFIEKHDRGAKVTSTAQGLRIAYNIMQDTEGDEGSHLIDLKQYFALSSKKKWTADGNWYVRVPIRVKTDQGRKAFGSKAWKVISHLPLDMNFDPGVDPAKIQKVLGVSQSGVLNQLKYHWKSANIMRTQWGSSGKRSKYFMVRTVGSKSPTSSWIVNRQGFSRSDVGQELAPYISAILDEQMKKYNAIARGY